MEKRYLKIFNTQDEYNSQKGDVMDEPYVVFVEETKEVIYEPLNEGPSDPFNGYEYVDLGLPSGIQWAKLNVGATKESDRGLFFQWGDTQGYTSDQCGEGEGQKAFTWTDYKWCNEGYNKMTKYCNNSSYGDGGFTDNKVQLDLKDDGCHVHMGGDWRLPTGTNMQELTVNTNFEYATIDGIEGAKFINKSDSSKYIFLPAGSCYKGSFVLGSVAISWSSSLNESNANYAWFVLGSGDGYGVGNIERFYGLPLRGVVG